MQYTAAKVGHLVRATRIGLGLSQGSLAMVAGTGLRFIIDLEKGKPTCQIEKVLTVLHTLGIRLTLASPLAEVNQQLAEAETR